MSGLRIDAVRLPCRSVARSAAFYRSAFGFRPAGVAATRPPWPAAGRAHVHVRDRVRMASRLRLGAQHVELVPARRPGTRTAASNGTDFQHFAIIVRDMDAAMRRLRRTPGWRPISRAGPEALPAASGDVVAFKFRDPDGHPLELLEFPADAAPSVWRDAARTPGAGACLGIDHTAITVADTDVSVAFYARLGFGVMQRQVNRGPEQARMDAVAEDVEVEVTGLAPPGGEPPHLELLCYRVPATRGVRVPADDRRATRVLLTGAPRGARRGRVPAAEWTWVRAPVVRDPDGHRLGIAGRRRRTGAASTDPLPGRLRGRGDTSGISPSSRRSGRPRAARWPRS